MTGGKLAANSVLTPKLADNSVTGAKVLDNSIWGADIEERTLDVNPMGCDPGKVNGFARIKASASMGSSYSHVSVDRDGSCGFSGTGLAFARRASVGVYYVRFENNLSNLAVATPNSDGATINTAVRDNIVSVARIPDGTCNDCGSFRVQVEDVSATGTGTVPADGWFTIMVM